MSSHALMVEQSVDHRRAAPECLQLFYRQAAAADFDDRDRDRTIGQRAPVSALNMRGSSDAVQASALGTSAH